VALARITTAALRAGLLSVTCTRSDSSYASPIVWLPGQYIERCPKHFQTLCNDPLALRAPLAGTAHALNAPLSIQLYYFEIIADPSPPLLAGGVWVERQPTDRSFPG
jgi:hypothetical protein